ncbi:MAG: hypothetical protein LBS09_00580 [Bacteroidales bacterium]|jgi:hypothetical protein|nr:hypothetical protein [Bacteroidales bacterium]
MSQLLIIHHTILRIFFRKTKYCVIWQGQRIKNEKGSGYQHFLKSSSPHAGHGLPGRRTAQASTTAAENFAVIRKIALNLLKKDTARKASVQNGSMPHGTRSSSYISSKFNSLILLLGIKNCFCRSNDISLREFYAHENIYVQVFVGISVDGGAGACPAEEIRSCSA